MRKSFPLQFSRRPARRMLRFLHLLVVVIPLVAALGGAVSAQGTARPRWQQLAADASGPTARWDHTLAADDSGRQLLLFGGRTDDGTPLGDTWRFDLTNQEWQQLTGPGPSARFGHSAAVDQEARRLYLFGGQADGTTFFNDAWMLDLATEEWSEINAGDGPRPQPRYGSSAVLTEDDRLLISHGFTDQGRFDDTWSLDLNESQWTDVSPPNGEVRPLPRCLHETVWDTAAQRMLLFGGCSSGYGPCPQGDLWAFDPAERTWAPIENEPTPAPRSNPALAIDPERDRALLLAGLTADGYAGDLWSLALGATPDMAWTQLNIDGDAPSARSSLDAVISGDNLYLFGGISDQGALADLWQLNIETLALT
jgi:Galactose oxidase, central domain